MRNGKPSDDGVNVVEIPYEVLRKTTSKGYYGISKRIYFKVTDGIKQGISKIAEELNNLRPQQSYGYFYELPDDLLGYKQVDKFEFNGSDWNVACKPFRNEGYYMVIENGRGSGIGLVSKETESAEFKVPPVANGKLFTERFFSGLLQDFYSLVGPEDCNGTYKTVAV